MKHNDRTLRIIGGKWRGRKISFPETDSVRPTGDRVRETLFNWLMHNIQGARCLDLFSGTGALGLEALSRGAAHVTLIERDEHIADVIRHNLEKLKVPAENHTLQVADALPWLSQCTDQFDIIFLDPPFHNDNLEHLLDLVSQGKLARQHVYVESAEEFATSMLPAAWKIHRKKKSGAVHYALLSVI